MIIIDYNPAKQIPPIVEKDINTKIILSVFKESNLFMAIKHNNKFTWFGCDLNSVWSINRTPSITIHCMSTSLINLLIDDYNSCNGKVVFYVLEDIFDVAFIEIKYNLQEVNTKLLEMLRERAKEVFPR
jgi:hypothetical protein